MKCKLLLFIEDVVSNKGAKVPVAWSLSSNSEVTV